jgi:hypothetical protein
MRKACQVEINKKADVICEEIYNLYSEKQI